MTFLSEKRKRELAGLATEFCFGSTYDVAESSRSTSSFDNLEFEYWLGVVAGIAIGTVHARKDAQAEPQTGQRMLEREHRGANL